jgi:hypothetical protein
MSKYAELATQAGDQYLGSLAKAQDAYLGIIAQFTKQMPQSPAGEGVPAAVREVAGVSLSFAQKALDQQKAYVEKLLTSTEADTVSQAKA